MKKIVLFPAALLALTLASCTDKPVDKKDSPLPDAPVEKVIPPAPKKEKARKFTITDKDSPIKTIELTESGNYIAEQVRNLENTSQPEEHILFDAFIETKENDCDLKNLGRLVITPIASRAAETYKLELTLYGSGKTLTFTATTSDGAPVSGDFAYAFCRTWIPKETVIQVMGDDVPTSLGVGRVFEGCDCPGIVKYLKDNGINGITETLEGYAVQSITFTAERTFCIVFDGQEPYYGELDADVNTGKFSYEFEGDDANILLNGQGTGSLELLGSGQARMVLNAVIVADKNYAAKLTLTLDPAEKK